MTSHREALATAIRRVNADRSRLPEYLRPDFDERAWLRLLDRLDRCRTTSAALEAIEEWELGVRRQLSRHLFNAPLEPRR
ncbi:MAG: hypothetical protein M9964_00470 [Solirubrobacterales bacterium]|nr:hypothetical protein [Thermoleophilales bacterium]MCO5325527.1 hypothetical protein [Solirubrobacterales bacterium]